MKVNFLVSGFQGVRERPEIGEIGHEVRKALIRQSRF